MNNETTQGRSSLAAIFSISAVMFSAYVGPGFASGTQTVSYFLTKGWVGVILGPLVAGLLCFIFNVLLFEINRVYKPRTYREAYNIIYRPKALQLFFGTFKEIQVVVVILIALSAQISTSALLLNQIFGLPVWLGSVLFCVAVLFLAIWGAALLRKVGTALTICILAICIFVAAICIGNAIPGAMDFLAQRTSWTAYGYSNGVVAWFQMLMIVVFFMNGYEACVPASIGIINTRRDVILQSLITAVLSTASTMIFTIIFAAGMPGIVEESIPTLWAIDTLSSSGWIAKILYVVFAMAAMLSSCVAFIFTVCDRFEEPLARIIKGSEMFRKVVIALFFILICTFGSSFGLLNIIKYGYTTFTTIVGPVMLVPLIVSVPYRLWKENKL